MIYNESVNIDDCLTIGVLGNFPITSSIKYLTIPSIIYSRRSQMNTRGITVKKSLMALVLTFTMLMAAACANATQYSESEDIVESGAVLELMKSSGYVLVDARAGKDYRKGHIEGAISIPDSSFVSNSPVKNMAPSKDEFEKLMSQKGIKNSDAVLIYDDSMGVNASRLWWTMKLYGHKNVKVVNGGAKALLSEGLAVTAKSPATSQTDYSVSEMDKNIIASIGEVESACTNPSENTVILDVRTSAEYNAGHIPGAILYPHENNVYSDGTFKSARDIYLDYSDLGIEKDSNVILYCKSSFRAAQTMLLLKQAGFENLKVYDGAYLEWSAKGMPVESPSGAPVSSQDAS